MLLPCTHVKWFNFFSLQKLWLMTCWWGKDMCWGLNNFCNNFKLNWQNLQSVSENDIFKWKFKIVKVPKPLRNIKNISTKLTFLMNSHLCIKFRLQNSIKSVNTITRGWLRDELNMWQLNLIMCVHMRNH